MVRERQELQKERQLRIEAEAALAVRRRPYFTVQNPDQTFAVGRPAERDYLEQHVRRTRPRFADRVKGCFCVGKGRQDQVQQLGAEQWQVPQPQLVQ